eukprot:TRINITY_DN89890_c0_g1_i1.p1 TRINITY_DN89890_c0_g1~~TRINITY_DN89890_c0_g1_i1.p1  ORF type:complete len:263 (+),score=52.00 TRINITY_DN89890_c0_g1_i1:54-791(+)
MADGLLYPWVKPFAKVWLQGLKAKPELNGKAVSIISLDTKSGRWLCKLIDSGERLSFKAANLAETEEAAEKSAEPTENNNFEWLVRGVHVVVHGRDELENQIVRVLNASGGDLVKCVVRATNEQVEVHRSNLRPVAGAETPKQTTTADAPATRPTVGSDWAAAELERRRLAEGFRSGFSEGAVVILQGLSTAELNGKTGKLVSWDSQALRWKVELEDGTGAKALRPANLIPQEAGGPATKRHKTE